MAHQWQMRLMSITQKIFDHDADIPSDSEEIPLHLINTRCGLREKHFCFSGHTQSEGFQVTTTIRGT